MSSSKSSSPITSPRKKRSCVFESVSSINDRQNIGERGLVNGVVTSLSPKKGKFFDGSLEDESGVVRFVGFNEPQRLKIADFVKEKQPVKFTNCKIQKAYGGGDGVEIVLSDHSGIQKSEKDFKIEFPNLEAMLDRSDITKDIKLGELEKEAEFQKVNVKVKIADVSEAVTLGNKSRIQKVTVVDESGTSDLTLWENDIGKLWKGNSYKIENLMVKYYRGECSLTSPKTGIIIEETEDLLEVDLLDVVLESNIHTLESAKVIAVQNLQSYRVCPMCKIGRMIPNEDNSDIGSCVECSSIAVISACKFHICSQLVVMSDDVDYQLKASGSVLLQIGNKIIGDTLSEMDLLLCKEFTCKYSKEMEIIDIFR